jgi:hypothetical protein
MRKPLTGGNSQFMLTNGKLDVCYNARTAVDGKHKPIAAFKVINAGNDKNYLTPTDTETSRKGSACRVRLWRRRWIIMIYVYLACGGEEGAVIMSISKMKIKAKET